MKYCTALILYIIVFHNAFSAIVSGRVYDEKGAPLAFVNIYPQGLSKGTTSNADGYYSIELEQGEYTLVFKLISFKLLEKKVVIENASIELDVNLQDEGYSLPEVDISNHYIDPAIDIIKKAQAKRNYYLNEEIMGFSCRAYVKSLGRIGKAEIKNKLLGIKLFDVPKIPQNKIVYFAESISEVYYARPQHFSEKMLHSKVSGHSKAYSFASAYAMFSEVNFYSNNMPLGEISERPFISPIANNAFNYYDYQLVETFPEQGEIIHKIKVIPLKQRSPVFRGYIYIIEGSWRIYSINLTIDKESGIEYIDTLSIQQTFAPQEKGIWMPISQKFALKFNFDVKVASANGSGYVTGVFSNYKISSNVDLVKNDIKGISKNPLIF